MFFKEVLVEQKSLFFLSCQTHLVFAMCLSCKSPASREAHLLRRRYLSCCLTSGTLQEEVDEKSQTKDIDLPLLSPCSKWKLPLQLLLHEQIITGAKRVNSVMKMAPITRKHLLSYEYLTFPVVGFVIFSLSKPPSYCFSLFCRQLLVETL